MDKGLSLMNEITADVKCCKLFREPFRALENERSEVKVQARTQVVCWDPRPILWQVVSKESLQFECDQEQKTLLVTSHEPHHDDR